MSWYYALNGQQKGPVEQSELERLIREGELSAASLVWREGMPQWRPCSEVLESSTPLAGLVGAAPGGFVCSQCGATFPPDQVIRLGRGNVCASCKPIATQKLREGVLDQNTAERIRLEHIKHEASLKSVGFLYFLGAPFVLLAGVIGISSPASTSRILPSMLFLGLVALQLWGGIGLRRLQPWARIPSGILSGIGLLGFPIGTLISGYILYLLFSKKGATVFSEDYKRIIAETPHIKYRTSIVLWILLVLLLVLIGAGVLLPYLALRR
jgi:hypothetical protein